MACQIIGMFFCRFWKKKIWFWLGAIVTTSHIKFLMIYKSFSVARMMGCCSCFGFSIARKPKRKPSYSYRSHPSQELLLDDDLEDDDDCSYNDDATSTGNADESEQQSRAKRPDEILSLREQNGMICRQYPVKETHKVVRTEVIYFCLFCFQVFNFVTISLKVSVWCLVLFHLCMKWSVLIVETIVNQLKIKLSHIILSA